MELNVRLLQSRNVSFHTEYDPNRQSSHYAVSTLWISASLINNNSEITCILSVFGGGEVTRISAFLLVQGNSMEKFNDNYIVLINFNFLGLLDQPQNISIVSNSYSLIHFKWSPPFSLEITDLELEHQEAILYYEVSITNKASNEVIINTIENAEYINFMNSKTLKVIVIE